MSMGGPWFIGVVLTTCRRSGCDATGDRWVYEGMNPATTRKGPFCLKHANEVKTVLNAEARGDGA